MSWAKGIAIQISYDFVALCGSDVVKLAGGGRVLQMCRTVVVPQPFA